jgi:hypothetical protein
MQNLFFKKENYLNRRSKKCESWSFIKNKEATLTEKLLKFTFYVGCFSVVVYIGIGLL